MYEQHLTDDLTGFLRGIGIPRERKTFLERPNHFIKWS